MKRYNRNSYKLRIILLLAVTGLFFTIKRCSENCSNNRHRKYSEIIKNGTIKVAIEYNTTNYFIKDDTIEGFSYELIKLFAKDKGIDVQFIPMMSLKEQIAGLKKGSFDLIAREIANTEEVKEEIRLTQPIRKNKQVLIQLNSPNKIKSMLDLADDTVYVVEDSPAILRLKNLSNEIADTIFIKEIKKYGQEQLIDMIAYNEIKYAICDEAIAQSINKLFPKIDINTPVNFTQFYSWAVNKKSKQLADTIDVWIDEIKKSKVYHTIYKRYYNK